MEKFIRIPNTPEFIVQTAILDFRADVEIVSSLEKLGVEVIKTDCCEELYDAIKGHPDILVHHAGDNSIIIAPNIYDSFALKLEKKGFALTKGAAWLHRNYPLNIAYNVLRIGKLAFHNTKYTDTEIRLLYEKLGVRLVHVNQGYTKCSVCVVNEFSAITQDAGIAKAMENNGIDVLLVESGDIDLIGLDYGFIGGASGLISNKVIVFSGVISEMKSFNKIMEFLTLKGIDIKILSNKKIMDIGSIIPVSY